MMEVEDIGSGFPFYLRLLFNIGFFTFVNVILLNIIFGLIIDGFASLRDSDKEKCKYPKTNL